MWSPEECHHDSVGPENAILGTSFQPSVGWPKIVVAIWRHGVENRQGPGPTVSHQDISIAVRHIGGSAWIVLGLREWWKEKFVHAISALHDCLLLEMAFWVLPCFLPLYVRLIDCQSLNTSQDCPEFEPTHWWMQIQHYCQAKMLLLVAPEALLSGDTDHQTRDFTLLLCGAFFMWPVSIRSHLPSCDNATSLCHEPTGQTWSPEGSILIYITAGGEF
jgi:hypothetical protein